ncbi:MAG: DUF1501 domain-containing protein [Pirellulales bacterium]
MFTLKGSPRTYCDGLRRRDFLKIGALSTGTLAFGGLSLADVYRAEAATNTAGAEVAVGGSKKSIINIYLGGGPSHLDMFDLKPNAPAEIRGEFTPTATNVSGMEINGLFSHLSKMADKFAVIRSMTGIRDEHAPNQSESGYSENDLKSSGGFPSLGAVVSKLHGTTNGSVPRFIDLNGHTKHGFLGAVYGGFRPEGNGRENLKLRTDVSLDRLSDRANLLKEIDGLRRTTDNSRMMEAMDSFNQRAIDVVTGSKMAQALKLEDESPKLRDRYGLRNGDDMGNGRFLLARRLIEVGARVVSLSWGGWDTHSQNFDSLRKQLPRLDAGLSALIQDLDDRGMLQDTIIVMWGEFGRTPRINMTAGRDHWSCASSCFIAGGGLKTGQVIGSTNRYGEAPQDRPVQLGEVFATLYRHMGIDPQTTLNDNNGRPQYITKNAAVVNELV